MPRGRSSTAAAEEALRELLTAESDAGRIHLAGIAVSYATGMAELTGRRVVERTIRLRGTETDTSILIRLNPDPGTIQ